MAAPNVFAEALRILQEQANPPARHNYLADLRPNQTPPDTDWLICLAMAGRGFGKTHAGARWLLHEASRNPGEYAVVAPTFTDVRAVCVEGPSGILRACAPDDFAGYHKTKNEITLTNGSVIHMLSADQPDRIRGYNFRGVWCDELGAWRYDSAWYDGLVPALRIGDRPRAFITTTPRSTRLMRDLASRTDGTFVLLRGSTWDNRENLSAAALAEFARWEGTTRGRQELHGELLEDMPGANWRRPWIDQHRTTDTPDLHRIVIGVDPSGNSGDGSDECGIVVAGIDHDQHVYVLDDASLVASPDGWARTVVHLYDRHQADRVVAEKNFGGDMVEATLRHVRADLPVRMVTASRGKAVRAEPVAALYEQGRVHHVGAFPDLEDQMTQWEPSNPDSPDRMDALVWAVTELATGDAASAFLEATRRRMAEHNVTVPTSARSWRDTAAALREQRTTRPTPGAPPPRRPPIPA